MPFAATWVDLEIVMLSEVSQTKTVSCDITSMWNLKKKKDTNELNIKQKQTYRHRKQTYSNQREKERPRNKSGVWD